MTISNCAFSQLSYTVEQKGEYFECCLSYPEGDSIIVIRQSSRRPVDALAHALAVLSDGLLALPREDRELHP